MAASTLAVSDAAPPFGATLIDHSRCTGCHACTTACKSENQVPLSVTRTYVKYVDVGRFPYARRVFQVARCSFYALAPVAGALAAAQLGAVASGRVAAAALAPMLGGLIALIAAKIWWDVLR
jgi:ferredoxin